MRHEHTGYFYSHARVGRDLEGIELDSSQIDFYSHARVGRDQAPIRDWGEAWDFYSHARVGRDTSGA